MSKANSQETSIRDTIMYRTVQLAGCRQLPMMADSTRPNIARKLEAEKTNALIPRDGKQEKVCDTEKKQIKQKMIHFTNSRVVFVSVSFKFLYNNEGFTAVRTLFP